MKALVSVDYKFRDIIIVLDESRACDVWKVVQHWITTWHRELHVDVIAFLDDRGNSCIKSCYNILHLKIKMFINLFGENYID